MSGAPSDPQPRPTSLGAPLDSAALLAEIERDVRDRRRRGEITEEFEAELDRAFSEVSPPGSTGGGFDTVVDQAARHAIVDYDAPITGSKPLQFVKRVVKLLTAWYMIFVGRQLVAFAGSSLRAMRILAGRVEHLERQSPASDPRIAAQPVPVLPEPALQRWVPECVAAIEAVQGNGRVLHADCGDGALTVALHTAGFDVYGTDPRVDAGRDADAELVEVRKADVLGHLRSVSAASLRAVVLTGCPDRLALGDQLELVSIATAAVASDGVVVLIGSDPRAWVDAQEPVAADLAAGRPLHHDTWAHLFDRVGWSTTVNAAPPELPAVVAESTDPVVQALATSVFRSRSFCLVARRS